MNERNICYNCFCERTEVAGSCPNCGYDPEWDKDKYPLALPHGHVLCDKYILGRVLGQGGYGITYLAIDKWLGTKVAIKEYFPQIGVTRTTSTCHVTATSVQKEEDFEKGKTDFLQEARVLAAFADNPNIVRIHGYFEENGTAYFAMDYVQGISLQKYIANQGGKIYWKDAYEKLMPIIKALEEVHKKDMIHRDISPDNIYISSDGTMKLLDFGAARAQSLNQSHSLDVVLKHGYAPIEQYSRRGKQGPFTDVYAVCACFYAVVTGYLPPDATERVIEDTLSTFESLGFTIPQALSVVIYKGLAVNIENRYQNMTELRNAMEAALKAPEKVNQSTVTDTSNKTIKEESIKQDNSKSFHGVEKKAEYLKRIFQRIKKQKYILVVIIILMLIFGIKGIYQFTHDHTFADYTVAKEATCTKDGLIKWKCSCGAVKKEVIPAAHKMEILPAVDATCTQTGLTEGYVCSVCGYAETQQQVIEALGHTPVTDAAVPATCMTSGKTEGSHCSTCGEIIVQQESLGTTGHNFVTNVCQNCAELEWRVEMNSDKNTYTTNEYLRINLALSTYANLTSKISYEIYRNGSLVQTSTFDDAFGNGDTGSIFWDNGVGGYPGILEVYVYNGQGYQIGYYTLNIVD